MADTPLLQGSGGRLRDLEKGRVLVVGDVMLDTYLIGDAQRISPEAPVPVVRIDRTRHLLGGAGNVARNIVALGGQAAMVGLVGKDADGAHLESLLTEARVEPHLVPVQRPTTVKSRVMARNQQMIRLDWENSAPASTEEYRAVMDVLTPLVPEYDVVVVSDYGKGMVTGGLVDDVRRLGRVKTGREPLVLVDPKPQHKSFYQGAYLLTPNAKETSEAAGLPVDGPEEILAAGRRLREDLHIEHVLTTLGADGMALFSAEGPVWHVATAAQQVFDVTGAGDTVIATVALALSVGFPLLDACVLANYAAGVVVGKVGASTASLDELAAAMQEVPPQMERWE